MNTRIIHTGLYSDKAYIILSKFFKDAKSRINRYGITMRSLDKAYLKKTHDGEVVIQCDIGCSYSRKTIWDNTLGDDFKAKDWLANKIKENVRECLGSHNVWCRDNNNSIKEYCTTDENITVKDVYLVYDILKERSNIGTKYTNKEIKDMKGEQLDPLKAEMNRIIELKLNEASKEFETIKQNIYNERHAKLTAFENQLQIETNAMLNEARKNFEAKINEIKNKVTNVSNVSPLFAGVVAA